MNLKTVTDNILLLGLIAAGAYGLYYHLSRGQESDKAAARYHENEQETRFDQIEDAGGNLDDCYRYTDPDSIEACIEKRTKQQSTD